MLTSALGAAGPMLDHEPEVSPWLEFRRSLDMEGYAGAQNANGLGMQTFRLRTRYLDPDINAFVGLLAGFHHFNQDLRIGNPAGPSTAGVMANWGGDFGIVRGNHLWELDLMGANLSDRLGFAIAIVGEHQLTNRMPGFGQRGTLVLFHRTEANIFTGDSILDADQGMYWMWNKHLGIVMGYRWVTSLHMDKSGPHVGLRLYFETPKIPFIFPSIG